MRPRIKKNDPQRLAMFERRRVQKWMKEVGIPMNIERARLIAKEAKDERVVREIFEQAAHIAEMVEKLQENDYGAANTGGAAAAARAIRDYCRIFYGKTAGPMKTAKEMEP